MVSPTRCFVVPLLVFAACSGGARGDRVAVGIVTEGDGVSPIAAVTVSALDSRVVTGADGRFELPVGSGTTVVRFDKELRPPVFRVIDPNGAEWVTMSVAMPTPDLATTIDVRSAPGQLTNGVFAIDFPIGSIVLEDGSQPTGPVDAIVTFVSAAEATSQAPLPLVGTDGGEQELLVSFGMIDVTLRADGQPANIAPGETVRLSLPAATDDPAEAGLFFGDPGRGIWVLEGAATNDGATWTADLPHLSWWNVDAFGKVDVKACLKFVARTPDGDPLPGVDVRTAWGPNLSWTASGTTDNDGTLCSECFPYEVPIQMCYRAFLDVEAGRWIEGCQNIVPSSRGLDCNDVACQTIDLTAACANDDECGHEQLCVAGACRDDEGNTVGADFVDTWALVSAGGQPVGDLGVTQTLTFTETIYSGISTSLAETCTFGGTVDFWDAATITITTTMSDCMGLDTPYTQTASWDVTGDILTMVSDGTTSIYTRAN